MGEHNDHIRTNDANLQPSAVSDAQQGATAALHRDAFSSPPVNGNHAEKPETAGKVVADAGNELKFDALNMWNGAVGADLTHGKVDKGAEAKDKTEQSAMAALGLSDQNKGHGENSAIIAEQHRREAFAALFGGNREADHKGMSQNQDGRALASSNQHLNFNNNRQLSFA